MLALGAITVLYSVWSLFYLSTVPFTYETAFGMTHEEIVSFNHGVSTWVDLQVSLKTLYVSLILATGVLICFVSYFGYRRAEKWAWFALLLGPIFPLLSGTITVRDNVLNGLYGVSAIDMPIKLVISLLVPFYILGLALSAGTIFRPAQNTGTNRL
jgi:hypothetical protein